MTVNRPAQPAPELSGIDVANIVIEQFCSADVPTAKRTFFNFAAPELRAEYNGFDGIDWYLENPSRKPLLEWTDHSKGLLVEVSADQLLIDVLSRGEKDSRTFELALKRQSGGKYDCCWMVTGLETLREEVRPEDEEIAIVEYGESYVSCQPGTVLRDLLLDADGIDPHNGIAETANCGGNGLCGTCAVGVRGETGEQTTAERRRLRMPPLSGVEDCRLSCQTTVEGDIKVSKHGGLWGQHGEGGPTDEVTPVEPTEAEYEGSYQYETLESGK